MGRPLVLNVSGAIPAVLLDAGFPLGGLKGVPILARAASLIAHLVEEQTAADRLPAVGSRRAQHRVRRDGAGKLQTRGALNNMGGVLDGVRVIELTTMITGPLAGMLLADLGASVIKIENPEGGDPFRYFRGGNYSGHFIAYNRNKRSLTLDLRSLRGKEILLDLLKQADVLIDNFRHGVLDRLGFSDEMARQGQSKADPRLAHRIRARRAIRQPAFLRRRGAIAERRAEPVRRSASRRKPAGRRLSDNITGFYAAYGILGALHERERTGKGRRIETSMLEATIAFAPDAFINHKRYGTTVGPLTRVSASQSYAFRCKDGRLIAIHLSSQPKFWEGLLAAHGAQRSCNRRATSTAAKNASRTTPRCATSLARPSRRARALNGRSGSKRRTCLMRRFTMSTR